MGGGADELGPVLEREHDLAPFRPSASREAARRVVAIARGSGLDAQLVRGGVDVGPVEIDHLWARVEGTVVDASLPLFAADFRGVLRAWVAGDVDDEQLDLQALPYGIDWRVVTRLPPEDCRYRGRPVLHHRRPGG